MPKRARELARELRPLGPLQKGIQMRTHGLYIDAVCTRTILSGCGYPMGREGSGGIIGPLDGPVTIAHSPSSTCWSRCTERKKWSEMAPDPAPRTLALAHERLVL